MPSILLPLWLSLVSPLGRLGRARSVWRLNVEKDTLTGSKFIGGK